MPDMPSVPKCSHASMVDKQYDPTERSIGGMINKKYGEHHLYGK